MKVFVKGLKINATLWVFDKDGTITSLNGWAKIMEERLKLIEEHYGTEAKKLTEPILGFIDGKFNIKHILYTTRDETSRECAHILRKPQQDILNLFTKADDIINYNVFSPIEGSRKTLESLIKYYKVLILTNDLEKRTEKIMRSLSIPYHGVIGSDTYAFHKPDVRLIHEIMKKHSVNTPEEIVVVGDSKQDLELAKNTGAFFIGVLSGIENREGLKGADIIIESVNEIETEEE